MTYQVHYRKKDQWLWRKISKVKGDLVASDLGGIPMRIFILEDESRIEIPIEGTEFKFCSKRFLSIKQQMEKESGQKISI
jgi:hypothetical protein